jgi:hypothetical protein
MPNNPAQVHQANRGKGLLGEPVGKGGGGAGFAAGEPADNQVFDAMYFGFVTKEIADALHVTPVDFSRGFFGEEDVTRVLGALGQLVTRLQSAPQRVAEYLNRSTDSFAFSRENAPPEWFDPAIDRKDLIRMLYIIGGLAVASTTEADSETA